MLVFTLVFANFFDAMGTFTGLSREAGLADEQGTFPRLRSALIVEGSARSSAARPRRRLTPSSSSPARASRKARAPASPTW